MRRRRGWQARPAALRPLAGFFGHGYSTYVLALLILAAQVDPSVSEAYAPRPAGPRLDVRPGEAVFLEHRLEGSAQRFTATDRPNLEVGVEALSGPIDVAQQGEILGLEKTGSAWVVRVGVVLRSASAQGPASYRIRLFDRRGIGAPLVEREVQLTLARAPSRWTDQELALAFHAADQYRAEASRLLGALRRRGVRATLKVDEPRPPLLRARAETMVGVQAFEAARRRMGMAQRRLRAAARTGNDEAQRLLALLRSPRSKRTGVPPIPRDRGPAQSVAPAPPSTSQTDEAGVLEPIEAYELGSERAKSPPPPRAAPTPEPRPAPAPQQPVKARAPAPEEAEATMSSGPERPVRGLVLDGADIGFGGGTRFVYAEARLLRTAQTSAFFIFAEAAFTPDFGLQLDVPVQFVSLEDFEARDVTTAGNPSLTLKYRFWLPEAGGAPVALVVRGRYGLPLTPEARFAPTTVVADDFTREVHFTEPHTFLVDRHDLALGASGAWRKGWVSLSAQLWLDYFVPVGANEDLVDFTALSYGVGVGLLPPISIDLGPFVEFRGTSILAGAGRTEGVLYAGARARLFGWFEPAAYAGIPLGGLSDSSGVQAGVELRFSTPWPAPRTDPRFEEPIL